MPRETPKEERQLDRQGEKFATWYVKYRDIYKAAEKAHVAKNQAVRVFNRPEVQDEIERQEEVLRVERAKQQVETENLTNEILDRKLLKVIGLDETKHGPLILEAIRLGNVITGRIRAGNTQSLEPNGAKENTGAPNFYQAFVPMGVPVASLLPDERQEQGPEKQGTGIIDQGSETQEPENDPPESAPEVVKTSAKYSENYSGPPANDRLRAAVRNLNATGSIHPAEAINPPVRKAGRIKIG